MMLILVLLCVLICFAAIGPSLDILLSGLLEVSPNTRQIIRATNGAVMVVLAVYFASNTHFLLGPRIWPITNNWMWVPIGAWGFLLLRGSVALVGGFLRSSGSPLSIGAIASGLVWAAIGVALLWWGAYIPARYVATNDFFAAVNFLLTGIYIWLIVQNVGYLLLCARAKGPTELDAVKAEKAHGESALASEEDARRAKLIDQKATAAIGLGRHGFDGKGGVLAYAGERHLVLIGPNGSGKGTRVLIPDLLAISNRSVVVIDPKGELAAVTADYRRRVGDVVIINPFNELGLGSAGFNPLAALDATAESFIDDASGLGDALIKIEGKDPHWSESAQALLVAVLMWEVKTARDAGRVPSLERVRALLTEADEWEDAVGADGKTYSKLIKGLRVTARKMVASGGYEIESLASRFLHEREEIAGIRSAADTQTRWLLSPPVRTDLAKNGISFADLKKKPTTVYVILPAERMRTHSVWLRLVIVSALRSLYHAGGLPVLFMLDEFAQLGHLGPIEDAFALVRGYGVQLWPVLQDLNQLKQLYDKRWETFIANAGIVQCFAPNDLTTAEWMSQRAGETTVVAGGFNENVGGPRNEGMSYQQAKRRLLLPQELMDLPAGTGLLWQAGTAKAFPFFAGPYWDISKYRDRGRPNPYYRK